MMTAWGEFARNGNPGPVAGRAWPPFVTDAPHTMVLDGTQDSGVVMASPTLEGLLAEIVAPSSLMPPSDVCWWGDGHQYRAARVWGL